MSWYFHAGNWFALVAIYESNTLNQFTCFSLVWESEDNIMHSCCYRMDWRNSHVTLTQHDDVIKWKHLRIADPLWGEFTGEFPSQRPVTRSFDDFYDLWLNKQLSKQSWRQWFETPSCWLWCHCSGVWDGYLPRKRMVDLQNIVQTISSAWTGLWQCDNKHVYKKNRW